MKPILSLCLLFISLFSLGQSYERMIRNDVFWEVREGTSVYTLNYFDHYTFEFNQIDNFEIKGNKYSLLESSFVSRKVLLREDTLKKKVYYFNTNDSLEHILYDYDLKIGDSISLPENDSYPEKFKLVLWDIDSVERNGSNRKVFRFKGEHFNWPVFENWIEGIGSSFGPGRIPSSPYNTNIIELFCYNLKTRQKPTLHNRMCSPVGLTPQNETVKQIVISPNPVKNFAEITSENEIEKIVAYSISGARTQLRITPQEHSVFVDFSDLKPGIYFIQFYTENDVQTKQIIKQ